MCSIFERVSACWTNDRRPRMQRYLPKAKKRRSMIARAEFTLRKFDPLFAGLVASWVRSAEELFWLAPSTAYPLSAAKVVRWTHKHGNPLLYYRVGAQMPVGYGELNPMRNDPRHLWIGHVVLDPAFRGHGLGLRLTHALVDHAFGRLRARKLTLVVFPENEAAVRCYERVGFCCRGEERQCFRGLSPRHRLLRFEMSDASAVAGAALAPASADVAPI
jgi:RimJ/RimL family protein N-acetyltransferase